MRIEMVDFSINDAVKKELEDALRDRTIKDLSLKNIEKQNILLQKIIDLFPSEGTIEPKEKAVVESDTKTMLLEILNILKSDYKNDK